MSDRKLHSCKLVCVPAHRHVKKGDCSRAVGAGLGASAHGSGCAGPPSSPSAPRPSQAEQ